MSDDWRTGFARRNEAHATPWLTVYPNIPPGYEVVASWSMYPAAGEEPARVCILGRRETKPLPIDGHAYRRRVKNRRKR